MLTIKATVIDPIGIHARPASTLVASASPFKETEITITAENGRNGNLKSIMSVMALGIRQGETFTIGLDGGDEATAKEAIEKCLVSTKIAKLV